MNNSIYDKKNFLDHIFSKIKQASLNKIEYDMMESYRKIIMVERN